MKKAILTALIVGFIVALPAFAQQASFIILTGGGDKYIKPVGALWGLQWPGLATSTTGCLSVKSGGWISASGSACGGGSVTAVTGTWPIISSGGTTPNITFGGLGTTTNSGLTVDRLIYTSHLGVLTTTASSSETCTSASGISCTSFDVLTGGGAISLSAIPNTSLSNSSLTVNATQGIAGGGSIALGATRSLSLISYLATSSGETAGQLAYWGTTNSTPAKLTSVATTSITCTGNITCTGFNALGAASSIAFTGTLPILNGGTNGTAFTNGLITAFDGTRLSGTSTPTIDSLHATSTTNASIFDGSVGIGTSSPEAIFSVQGSSAFPIQNLFAVATTGTNAAAGEAMRITNNGRTIFGTSTREAPGGLVNTPQTVLQLYGNASNPPIAYIYGENAATGLAIERAQGTNSSLSWVRLNAGGTPSVFWKNGTAMSFGQASSGENATSTVYAGLNPALVLNSSSAVSGGSVEVINSLGIATTTPGWALSVVGAMGITALPTESASQSAVCYNPTTGGIVYNTGAGSTCLLSSERFKNTILSLDFSALSEVLKLRPVTYYENADKEKRTQEIGFIAEEVQKVDSRFVNFNASGTPQSVRYEQLTALLAGAIQEQQQEITDLQTRVKALDGKDPTPLTQTIPFGAIAQGLGGAVFGTATTLFITRKKKLA